MINLERVKYERTKRAHLTALRKIRYEEVKEEIFMEACKVIQGYPEVPAHLVKLHLLVEEAEINKWI